MYFPAFYKRKAKLILSGMSKSSLGFLLFLICLISATPRAGAQLSGNVNFVVLKVTFSDFGTATHFTQAPRTASRLCSNDSSVIFRCPTPRRRACGQCGQSLFPPACHDTLRRAPPRS